MRVETDWGSLSAIDEGEGPAVILLHSLAQSGEMWRPVVDKLAANFRVIAPDARGHGASRWDGKPFTVQDLAADVAQLVRYADIGTASVVGMSMGGSTAIDVAINYPDLVDRLVLADTTADYGPDKAEAWENRARNAVEKPRQQQMDFQYDRWFSPWFLEVEPQEARRVADIFLRTDSQAQAAACRALGAFDDSGQLTRIVSPTLVLVGEEDYATPPSMAQDLYDAIAGSRLEILAETRHLSLIQNRESWTMIIDHLRGAPSGGV